MKRFFMITLSICLLLAMLPAAAVSASETPSGPVKQIVLGQSNTAVVTEAGALWTWGSNNDGQLGDGTKVNRASPVKIMENVKSFYADHYFMSSSVVKTDGSLWIWGNVPSEAGSGVTDTILSPQKLMDNVESAVVHYYRSIALKTDGSLWAWGMEKNSVFASSTPVKILDNVASFSNSHAIGKDGSLWTWGNNSYGTVGDGTTETRNKPVKIMDNVAEYATTGGYCMAVKRDGSLWAWGKNINGCLGDGTFTDRLSPVKILDNVASVSLDNDNCAAIKTDGTLWTWGGNQHGQLGNGTTQSSSTPVKVMNDVRSVITEWGYDAAIKKDGSLWTWGYNQFGIIGDGTTTDRSSPVKVMDNVASVYAGEYDGMTYLAAAIKTDGTLWTWGSNSLGALGNGSKDRVTVPKQIMDHVVSFVNKNSYCSAAIKQDGSLWRWGGSYVGDGTDETRYSPIQIFSGKATSLTLPDATQYVSYRYAFSGGSRCSVTSGKLPAGLSLSSDGILSGIPTELGVFSFTVTAGSGTAYACRLSVLWAGGVDVEKDNEPGYGFVETATDDGRVHDQFVTSTAELKPQTMHCEGAFSEFYALYLDARKLTRGTDYTASAGSSKLTLTDKTFETAGSGTHVLIAEFHKGQQIKYTTQKYTITGIPGKNVNVVVKGVPVIWTDAQPYVNSDSRTMVPFRAIADALGLTVDWNSSTREAIFSNGSKTIYFPLDSKTARTSTGGTVAMDTAAVSVNGRSYAPVRYLAEFFGYTVTWDGKTRTVGIG